MAEFTRAYLFLSKRSVFFKKTEKSPCLKAKRCPHVKGLKRQVLSESAGETEPPGLPREGGDPQPAAAGGAVEESQLIWL